MAISERIPRLADLVVTARREVTGQAIDAPDFELWPTSAADASTFADLVTECYKWLQEDWQHELRFLMDRSASLGTTSTTSTRTLIADVVDLRTARQHTDNPKAVRQSRRWLRSSCGSESPNAPDDWAACAARLLEQVEDALQELVGVVRLARADESAAEAWRRMATVVKSSDPVAEREVVAADLGLFIAPSRVAHLDRQIDWEWRNRQRALTVRDDAELELTRVVERYLVGWSLTEIPCHYGDVLDRVGIEPGDADAVAVVRLAHVVADRSEYESTGEFLDHVDAAWQALPRPT